MYDINRSTVQKKFCKVHNNCLWYIYVDETGAEHQVCQECEDEIAIRQNKGISMEMRALQAEAEMDKGK